MATFLFDKVIFGPVKSRRLGESLGINLLPTATKVCNFDCIYCECGLTDSTKGDMPTRKEVAEKLEIFLTKAIHEGRKIDALTFAGNGEPTLHVDFEGIVEDTYQLRNTYYPRAIIALLTNATTIASPKIQRAFSRIDQTMLKLDSVIPQTVELLNCPIGQFNLHKIIEILKSMKQPIIQTMFVKGSFKGKQLNNTVESEIQPWLATLKEIQPSLVMIYTIARDTPIETLEKISVSELERIAKRVEALGIEVQISG
jgi:wyosine [tRNA(Phe)-imidazoG37] synthetase (radical SAM superfamily)